MSKNNGFGCSYGSAAEVPAVRFASGLLPAKFFISSSRFLLRPDVFTFTSTLRLVLFYAISTELRVGSYFSLIGASIFSFALLGF